LPVWRPPRNGVTQTLGLVLRPQDSSSASSRRLSTRFGSRSPSAYPAVFRNQSQLCVVRLVLEAQPKCLVAGWIGVVSAPLPAIVSAGSSSGGGGTDAYRHSTAYGRSTVNASAIHTTAVNTSVVNTTAVIPATASSSEGIRWNSRKTCDRHDNGGSKRNTGSM